MKFSARDSTEKEKVNHGRLQIKENHRDWVFANKSSYKRCNEVQHLATDKKQLFSVFILPRSHLPSIQVNLFKRKSENPRTTWKQKDNETNLLLYLIQQEQKAMMKFYRDIHLCYHALTTSLQIAQYPYGQQCESGKGIRIG